MYASTGNRGYIYIYGGFPKIRGTFLGSPKNKDYSIFGSKLGSPYLGKLPYIYIYMHMLTPCLCIYRYMYIPIYIYIIGYVGVSGFRAFPCSRYLGVENSLHSLRSHALRLSGGDLQNHSFHCSGLTL